jgi:uncharacterized protein YydD (DUF2326 family)
MFWTDNSLKEEIKRLDELNINNINLHKEEIKKLNNTIKKIEAEKFDLVNTNIGFKDKLKEKNELIREFKDTFNKLIK